MISETTSPDGRAVYDFTSRGTSYTVIADKNGETFTVFSERKSASFGTQIAVMSLKEMTKRAKVLSHLATLITSTKAAA
jgi:hypothetical protein